MATRFYFPSTGEAAVAPAFDASWHTVADRLACVTTRTNSPMTSPGAFFEGDLGNYMVRQYVSAPLQSQELTGTVKGQAMALQSDPDTDAFAQVVIRVVSGDGTTFRGTALAAHSNALSSEFNTGALRNRKFPLAALSPATLTPVTIQEGDRLVIEIGFRAGGASPEEVSIRSGDNGAADLPENETGSDGTLNPWLEFSNTLAFAEVLPSASAVFAGLGLGLGIGR